MSEFENECQKLNQMIKDSLEYRTYIFARNALQSHEELFHAVQDLKKRYSDVEQYTEGNPYDELRKIYEENDELLHNAVVNEYLRAENDFIRLLDKTLKDITSGISFEK